jgi:UDP-N-acetylmuramoyl-tripeptide--D-alanyl-D-alanine ligase
MRYRWRDIASLFATPVGRAQLIEGVNYRLWPVSSRLARVYRRTLVRRTRVVVIVGSSGKSTTVRAVAAAIDVPPADTLLYNAWGSVSRAMLRIARGQRHAVVETGIADKGQMRQYARVVQPDVTVVTSIGSEHHRSLGSLDVTRDEKAWMVRALPPGGTAVLNGDDPNVMWMKGETRARIVTFGFGAACDVRAVDARIDWPLGTRFRLLAFGNERDVSIRLLGHHMVYAALAAIAVAHLEGVPLADALARLAALAPTPGRLQAIELRNGATLLRDDYKSPVETIDAAIDVLEEIPARRRIVLLGEISEPPNPQHATYRRIGERVGRVAAHFLVVGTMIKDYRPGARAGGMDAARIVAAGDTPGAVAARLAALLEPGDVVLVKGRDTQRLARVCLILLGRTVGCEIRSCHLRTITCDECPMLERGWGAHRVVT